MDIQENYVDSSHCHSYTYQAIESETKNSAFGGIVYNSLGIAFGKVRTDIDEQKHQYMIVVAPQFEEAATTTPSETPAVTADDMISKVQKVFGLKVSQLADILQISRPSVYNHKAGKESESNEDYLKLYKLALEAEKIRPSFAQNLKNILVDGKTLLKHLKTDWKNPKSILHVCTTIDRKLSHLEPHSAKRESQAIATRRISKSG